MPERIGFRFRWSAEEDIKIRRMRVEGASWEAIADALGVSRYVVIERGRKIGAPRVLPGQPKPKTPERRENHALPAGHPETWGLLNAGTSLVGAAYPLPVFLNIPRRRGM